MLNFSFHIPTKFQETIMIWQPVFRAFGQDNDCNLCQISRLMTLDIILWIIQCKYWFKALSFLNSNNIQILLNSENLKFAIRILNFLRQKIPLIEMRSPLMWTNFDELSIFLIYLVKFWEIFGRKKNRQIEVRSALHIQNVNTLWRIFVNICWIPKSYTWSPMAEWGTKRRSLSVTNTNWWNPGREQASKKQSQKGKNTIGSAAIFSPSQPISFVSPWAKHLKLKAIFVFSRKMTGIRNEISLNSQYTAKVAVEIVARYIVTLSPKVMYQD